MMVLGRGPPARHWPRSPGPRTWLSSPPRARSFCSSSVSWYSLFVEFITMSPATQGMRMQALAKSTSLGVDSLVAATRRCQARRLLRTITLSVL